LPDLDPTSPLALVLLSIAGLAAGFVNTLAGGGSLLTLPALMLCGLPADLANGTNRVSVVVQSISGAVGYGLADKLDLRSAAAISAPTLVGALFGSYAAAHVSAAALEPVIVVMLLALSVTLLWAPDALAPAEGTPSLRLRDRPLAIPGLFLIGAYGGFLQAGVGLFLLAFMGGVLRIDLVRANALKVVAVGAFTAVSLTVFIIADKIVWAPGLVVAATSAIGAQLAVRYSLTRGRDAVLRLVFVMVVASCVGVLVK